MSGFTRSFNFLNCTLKPLTTLKTNISSKPAKHILSTGEQVFVMATIFVSILAPAGWVLSHLEEYKSR
ncbi:hypothetical protein AAFF_G00335180 [Aldrovandia affinis]|uniref:Uncharacterized protein n=1 Tax=Aldrovandia affinis TaxID=143900 RepID=A0AAD7WPX0_9TELE|nr:hypothetical protein AAFF_G00335180 [Aldrovandia affinis]